MPEPRAYTPAQIAVMRQHVRQMCGLVVTMYAVIVEPSNTDQTRAEAGAISNAAALDLIIFGAILGGCP